MLAITLIVHLALILHFFVLFGSKLKSVFLFCLEVYERVCFCFVWKYIKECVFVLFGSILKSVFLFGPLQVILAIMSNLGTLIPTSHKIYIFSLSFIFI